VAKPSEFHVGVVDFFAILLPGAIATALLAPRYMHLLFGSVIEEIDSEAGRWAAFLTISYLLGHLIFLLGSYIDRPYDFFRKRLRPYGNESAFQCAERIRDSVLDQSERKALNVFQWSRSVLIAKCPAAADDVHRLEADSKFFRSLLVVCGLASFLFFRDAGKTQGFLALLLALPCFARYYERRLKSTTQAYAHIVALHRLGALGSEAERHVA